MKAELIIGPSTIRDSRGNNLTRALKLAGHEPDRVVTDKKELRALRDQVEATLTRALMGGAKWARDTACRLGLRMTRTAGLTDYRQPSLTVERDETGDYVVERKRKPLRDDNAPYNVDKASSTGNVPPSFIKKLNVEQKNCIYPGCDRPFTTATGRNLCNQHAHFPGR